MTKELEALEKIEKELTYHGKYYLCRKEITTIKTALKALEIIKKNFEFTIDLRPKEEASFLKVNTKPGSLLIFVNLIPYEEAKVLKDVLDERAMETY